MTIKEFEAVLGRNLEDLRNELIEKGKKTLKAKVKTADVQTVLRVLKKDYIIDHLADVDECLDYYIEDKVQGLFK